MPRKPKLRFKPQEWSKLCRGLANSRAGLTGRDLTEEELEDRLDTAVLACWRFGEYAINTCLELNGEEALANHSHHERARDLQHLGVLKGSYYDTLEKLGRFRKHADYLSYNVGERSTHYNRTSLVNCLTDLEELRGEIEDLLRGRGLL